MSNEEAKTDGAAPASNGAAAAPAGAADPDSGAPAAAADEAPETSEQAVARLEREKAEAHDRMLRVAADFENYKRRSRRDMDDAAIRAKEQVLKEVLPVLDNLDRALLATTRGGTVESLAQGVKLVERQLLAGLEKFGIKAFEAKGEPFDPARHEAIQQVETTDHPPGTVVEEFARGYLIGERLLRPSMVAVAKAPAAASPPDGSGSAGGAPSTSGDN
jgi:molecular chaperone GrpE